MNWLHNDDLNAQSSSYALKLSLKISVCDFLKVTMPDGDGL